MRTTQPRLQPQQQESTPLPMFSFHISYALAGASRNGDRFGTHQFFLQIPANAPRYRGRLSRAAPDITPIAKSVAVYIAQWSTRLDFRAHARCHVFLCLGIYLAVFLRTQKPRGLRIAARRRPLLRNGLEGN